MREIDIIGVLYVILLVTTILAGVFISSFGFNLYHSSHSLGGNLIGFVLAVTGLALSIMIIRTDSLWT